MIYIFSEEKQVFKTVVVLFDLSGSTNKPEIRQKYSEAFSTILSRMSHGDALIVALITEKSVFEPSLPIKEEFPKFIPKTDNPLYKAAEERKAQEELQKKKDDLKTLADAVLKDQTRKIMKTDIMSSLQVAERIFKSFSQPKKVLVIMSDMIEDSEDYNFEKENLSEKRIEEIITREKNRERIPDLGGTKVYVVGANSKNLNQYYRVQNFWLRYFKGCGAILLKETYGSALINFNE
jgi:hypothetical protein